MADIKLKYLTDLASATGASGDDLMHINQGGNDRSITVTTLTGAIVNSIYPVGITIWFNSSSNPNSLFPGTTWGRLSGAGRTVRIANDNGSDVGQQGGSDSVRLTTGNIPAHNHSFSGSTEAYDHGTVNTANSGAHSHKAGVGAPGAQWEGFITGTDNSGWYSKNYTSTDGDHSHSVPIGAHSHKFSGETSSVGKAEQIDIKNSYTTQAAWTRVS
ncbi:putative tail fiber protein [Erwinia phage phiEt88]|uniref:tail protein n=1 Tax=Erwinia phage phiEt88 TaxID=925984 RepID=UPI0001F1FC6B|nr:tail protein [Erwinia phage phiEt88]CBX44538.1 putative tail fiber protein [Erwinia phage phiEt88]